jgi:hypothetical protein
VRGLSDHLYREYNIVPLPPLLDPHKAIKPIP